MITIMKPVFLTGVTGTWGRPGHPRESFKATATNPGVRTVLLRALLLRALFFHAPFSPLTPSSLPHSPFRIPGTGKTVVVQNMLKKLEPMPYDDPLGQGVIPIFINFSAQTSSLVRITGARGEGTTDEPLTDEP